MSNFPRSFEQARGLSYFAAVALVVTILSLALTAHFWYPQLLNREQPGPYVVVDSTLPLIPSWEFIAEDALQIAPVMDSQPGLYAATEKTIYALDPFSGHLRWKVTRERITHLQIVSADDASLLIVTSRGGQLVEALDTHTGNAHWQVNLRRATGVLYATARSYAVDGKRLYIGIGLNRGTVIAAYNLSDGTLAWNELRELPAPGPDMLTIVGDRLRVHTHQYFYLEGQTGLLLTTRPSVIYGIFRTAVFDGEAIYWIKESDDVEAVVALDRRTMYEQWRYDLPTNLHARVLYHIPQRPEDILLVYLERGTGFRLADRLLMSLDSETGQLRWQIEGVDTPSSAASIENIVYTIQSSATLQGRELATGKLIGELTVTPSLLPSFTSATHLVTLDNQLIVQYGNHQMLAFIHHPPKRRQAKHAPRD